MRRLELISLSDGFAAFWRCVYMLVLGWQAVGLRVQVGGFHLFKGLGLCLGSFAFGAFKNSFKL